MQEYNIAPHLDELIKALGSKVGTTVSKEDLEDELRKYMEYGVPPQEAVRTILRGHGENAESGAANSGPVKLADAPSNAPAVDTVGRLLTMNTRTVNARGEEKEIIWGLFGDETASLPYTSWRALEGLEKGDVIEVQGAYTKEYRGETQINFGDRTRIAKRDADTIPVTPTTFRPVTVEDLKEGLRGFEVTGRFLKVDEREVQVQGSPKTLWSGQFADTTGKIEFTCWDNMNLQQDQVVTIRGGYIRSFRGTPQFNFDKEATITPFEGEFAKSDDLDIVHTMTVGELVSQGDVGDAAVRATLLEVRPGSGLIFRDPETRRVTDGGTPGAEPDVRIKAILDDGTGCVQTIIGRADTEKLLGKTVEQCLEEAKAAFPNGDEMIARQIADKVTGRVFLAQGFSREDDFGVMFIARSIEPSTEDAEATAKELLETMGGA